MANTPDTTQRIINVTARTLEIAPSTIAATSTWTDDLGADSLAQAEILMNLEEEFQ
jgi:acyl carrier protein